MVKPRRLAVIPARGGSKRIPKKNIVDFHGKPIIYWTIAAALESGLFDDVVVSTDDVEIATIARKFGASVPFMRTNYADDVTPISMVTIDALMNLKEQKIEEYDVVVQLMANCPLRGSEHIKNAIDHFELQDVPAQLSCFRYGWMNPWWAVELTDNGVPTPLFSDMLKKRSQDLPKLFCPTGAIWIAKPDTLVKENSFYCSGHIFWELPWKAAVDIDDEDDLLMARALYLL